jgi:hypothetical protein
MKIIVGTIAAVLLSGTIAFSQEGPPKLNDVEKLKIQVMNLQIALQDAQENGAKLAQSYGECKAQMLGNRQGLTSAVQNLKIEIEKNHPGFDFDITTGTFKEKKPVEKK